MENFWFETVEDRQRDHYISALVQTNKKFLVQVKLGFLSIPAPGDLNLVCPPAPMCSPALLSWLASTQSFSVQWPQIGLFLSLALIYPTDQDQHFARPQNCPISCHYGKDEMCLLKVMVSNGWWWLTFSQFPRSYLCYFCTSYYIRQLYCIFNM